MDYVNAHGTGTRETTRPRPRRIREAFGEHGMRVPVSSLKPAIGHLLGAAGGAELALTVLAMRDGFLPPTLNLNDPDPSCALNHVANVGREQPIDVAVKIAAGFGGHIGIVVLERGGRVASVGARHAVRVFPFRRYVSAARGVGVRSQARGERSRSRCNSAGMFRRAPRGGDRCRARALRVDGREMVNFAGNDYLGLRRHPDVLAGAKRAMDAYGLGAGASRLLAGTTPVHAELERALAEFLGFERALVFASGYQANVGVLSSLAGEGDVLILDALDHASLIDAARLSKARMRVYPHADLARLEKLLAAHADYRRRFVVTEGVFSMDGDLAPLAGIVALG